MQNAIGDTQKIDYVEAMYLILQQPSRMTM